jgi:hypothetical protein
VLKLELLIAIEQKPRKKKRKEAKKQRQKLIALCSPTPNTGDLKQRRHGGEEEAEPVAAKCKKRNRDREEAPGTCLNY